MTAVVDLCVARLDYELYHFPGRLGAITERSFSTSFLLLLLLLLQLILRAVVCASKLGGSYSWQQRAEQDRGG